MKKFTSTALGGAPVFDDDLLDIFNSEIWTAIQALLSPFDSDTQGIVVSGCVTTNNAGNFDMTAGIVYLNGEFMRIAAVTNQSFTKYIAPSTPVNDDRSFADTTTHTVAVTKGAGLVGIAPGSGQYITIASLTDLNDRRWINIVTNKQVATQFQLTLEAIGGFRTEGSGAYLKTKVIDIGDWNMDTTSEVDVAHGLGANFKKIRSVSVIVRDDADTTYYDLTRMYTQSTINGTVSGFVGVIDSTVIPLHRTPLASYNGWFDGTGFDSTSYNRGWVTIVYEA